MLGNNSFDTMRFGSMRNMGMRVMSRILSETQKNVPHVTDGGAFYTRVDFFNSIRALNLSGDDKVALFAYLVIGPNGEEHNASDVRVDRLLAEMLYETH